MFSARRQKATLVAALAMYMAMLAVGNVVDPGTNTAYVQHVLSMDTILPYSTQKWRAVNNPELWRLAYVLILVFEAMMAGWLGWAAVRLFRASEATWKRARAFASQAVVSTLLLWLVGFIIVGGEWFQMWQSAEWNGIDSASKNFTIHGIILLYLNTPNDD